MLSILKSIKKERRKKRQIKSFLSSFLACIWVAVLLGSYYNSILVTVNPVTWISFKGILLNSAFILLFLIAVYIYYMNRKDTDYKEKLIFYENFYMSIFVTNATTLLLLYNPVFGKGKFLENPLWWVSCLMLITATITALIFYLKFRPEE